MKTRISSTPPTPAAERTRARLTVSSFEPVAQSGTLTGFATVEIPELQLRIRAAIHRDGSVEPVEASHHGRIVELRFGDVGLQNAFSRRVIEALPPDTFARRQSGGAA